MSCGIIIKVFLFKKLNTYSKIYISSNNKPLQNYSIVHFK